MNDTLKTIHALRSIHGNFTDQEISDADMQTILDATVRAANASARQSYSIVVVDDREVMKELGYVASRVLVFCVDYTRLIDQADHLGYDFNKGGMVGFVTGSTDTILAAQTAIVAARSLGIDSLATNCIHRGDIERVYRVLSLPERACFPLIAVVLGYATEEPEYLKGRLNGPGVIHRNTYYRLTDEEMAATLAQYDDPDRHMALNPNWEADGFAHYLDWFYGQWSGSLRKGDEKPAAAKKPSQLAELLRRAGFVD